MQYNKIHPIHFLCMPYLLKNLKTKNEKNIKECLTVYLWNKNGHILSCCTCALSLPFTPYDIT